MSSALIWDIFNSVTVGTGNYLVKAADTFQCFIAENKDQLPQNVNPCSLKLSVVPPPCNNSAVTESQKVLIWKGTHNDH